MVRKKFRQNLRKQVDVVGKTNRVVAFIDGTLQSVCLLKLFAENLQANLPKPGARKSQAPKKAQTPVPLDEHGKPLSKNKLKKLRKKRAFKHMFISGKAVFFDFRCLLGEHAGFLGGLTR